MITNAPGQAADASAATEPRRLFWRFVYTAALIAVTVGGGIMAAHWMGPLG